MSGVPNSSIKWQHVPVAQLDLKGRKAAVVGGTGGLGQAIARVLAARGAEVRVVGQTFRDAGTPRITFLKADMSLLTEAKRIGEALAADPPDLVVLTTGIFAAPKREETAEGLERDIAVSSLSRYAIVRALAPALRPDAAGHKPRVFVMGFPGTGEAGIPDDLNAEKKYEAMPQHMNTIAVNEALVLDAAKAYPAVNFYGLNPGLIKTSIRANVLGGTQSLRFKVVEFFIGMIMVSAEKYADRIVPLLVSPDLEPHSGAMFNQKATPILKSETMTDAHVAKLAAGSYALVDRALAKR